MKRVSGAVRRPFGSLPGLLVVVVAWEALIVASLAPFSDPLRPPGLAEPLSLDLGDVHRVGRIIMLYHSLAIPFVATLVYLILDQVPMGSLRSPGEGADGAPFRDRRFHEPAGIGPLCRRPTDTAGLAESLSCVVRFAAC